MAGLKILNALNSFPVGKVGRTAELDIRTRRSRSCLMLTAVLLAFASGSKADAAYETALTRSRRYSHIHRVWWIESDFVSSRVCSLGEPISPTGCGGEIESIRLESHLKGFGKKENPLLQETFLRQSMDSVKVGIAALRSKLDAVPTSENEKRLILIGEIESQQKRFNSLRKDRVSLNADPFYQYLQLLRDPHTYAIDAIHSIPKPYDHPTVMHYIDRGATIFDKAKRHETGRCGEFAQERYVEKIDAGGCYDTVHKVAWSRPASGFAGVGVGSWTRLGAIQYCATLNEGGKADWFLPDEGAFSKLQPEAVSLGSALYWTANQRRAKESKSAQSVMEGYPIGTYEVVVDTGFGFTDIETTTRFGTIHRALELEFERTTVMVYDAGAEKVIPLETHRWLSGKETRTAAAADEGPRRTPGAAGLTIETGPRRAIGPIEGEGSFENVLWSLTLMPSDVTSDQIGVVCMRNHEIKE